MHVEAQEVDEFARGIDLSLEYRLALVEHRGGVDRVSPGSREEVGRLEEDRCTILPGHPRPFGVRGRAGVYRFLDFGRPGTVALRKDMGVPMRHYGVDRVTGSDLFTTDDQRDLDLLRRQFGQPGLERRSLGVAGSVVPDGFVLGGRDPRCAIHLLDFPFQGFQTSLNLPVRRQIPHRARSIWTGVTRAARNAPRIPSILKWRCFCYLGKRHSSHQRYESVASRVQINLICVTL